MVPESSSLKYDIAVCSVFFVVVRMCVYFICIFTKPILDVISVIGEKSYLFVCHPDFVGKRSVCPSSNNCFMN